MTYISRVVSNLVGAPSRERLQKADWAAEMLSLLFIGECVHLVGDLLEPSLVCFYEADHASNLLSDDGLRNQRLSEHDALMCPL